MTPKQNGQTLKTLDSKPMLTLSDYLLKRKTGFRTEDQNSDVSVSELKGKSEAKLSKSSKSSKVSKIEPGPESLKFSRSVVVF